MTFPRNLLAAIVAILAASGTIAMPQVARADIEIEVNSGEVRPLPIAVPAFTGSTRGADMAQVITGNLERSGLFKPVDQAAFPERNLDIGIQPDFAGWKTINAQALINGAITTEGDGRLRVDFRLWDVFSGEQLLGLQFTSTPENWRRVAHKISDAVYERLTGEKGYFDTRVVFVAESGPRAARVKRLMIMDQDGANPSSLTDGSYVVMTPRFSTTSQEITYMALRPTGSSIYLFNIETARQETLGRFLRVRRSDQCENVMRAKALARSRIHHLFAVAHDRENARAGEAAQIEFGEQFSDGGAFGFQADADQRSEAGKSFL